ncbi:MAG: hypothetical protein NW206_20920 [Hyphomonadaceae bacterium]|nr:hypothetical protein [Hyphomonadaceae bacterium]
MGRPKGVVRRLADETGLDQATIRRGLAEAGTSEQACEANFAQALEIVRALADTARVVGHAANGRGEGGGAEVSAFADAKARREIQQVRKLEIQNAKAEGRLIDREAVTATGMHIIATARTALLSLGYRIAEKVADKTDVNEITRIVENEVRDVLGVLADEEAFFEALEIDALS